MKSKNVLLIPSLVALLLSGCGKGDPATGKFKIKFWGWGDEVETQVFKDLVKSYNANNTDDIYVEYVVKPSANYVSSMDMILNQVKKVPDIFYVGDGDVKRWASYGYLEDITSYVAASEIIDLDDIWEEGVNRYRYNTSTKTSNPTDPLYCLPKDIGPTVIYYNVPAFRNAGVTIISKPESECTEAEKHGFNKDTMTFNNRISMTVEEEYELAKLLTREFNPSSTTTYGFYTEGWFNYVWSVGGDCLVRDPDGTYHWTLGKTEANELNGVTLPSNREMFKHFIDRSVVERVMPNPSTVSSAAKVSAFERQNVAMLVGLRAHVPEFRKNCRFEWDVAPLSHQEGGRLAGHSGSMGFGISKKISQDRKDAAFKFMEYLAGPEGQKATAKSGFNLPTKRVLLEPKTSYKQINTHIIPSSSSKPLNIKPKVTGLI